MLFHIISFDPSMVGLTLNMCVSVYTYMYIFDPSMLSISTSETFPKCSTYFGG